MAKYDPHRLFQVLSNLIHNAIKFTPEGGAIRLRAARVAGSCQVSVSDTGAGIPEGDLTSIFERFRQLDRGDRTGLGLGLYIALWIVEAWRENLGRERGRLRHHVPFHPARRMTSSRTADARRIWRKSGNSPH